MTRVEFCNLIDEVLDVAPGTVTGSELLSAFEGWDSLAVVSFIAVVNQHIGLTLSAEKLKGAKSVPDLVGLLPPGTLEA